MSTTSAPFRPSFSSWPDRPATAPGDASVAGPIGLLDGTELVGEFKSSGYREASRLVARSDGRIVRLAPVLYAVVTALDHHAHAKGANRTEILSKVAEDVTKETGLELTPDHVAYLLDRKLAPLGITTDSAGSRLVLANSDAFLSLRLKKAILPSSASWFLSGLFSWLFYPVVVVAVVFAALAGEIWLFATQPMGSVLARALADPKSALLVGALALTSTFFHEIGHASACRYSGVRPGPIGFGVYLVYPAFYTDITNSYRLERSGRLRTVLGGVYFNAVFIIGLTLLFTWTGSPFLLAAILIVNLELVQQLLPTIRLDGYFIVSDLVGVPDLFKYIGPILKRTVLRQPADERLRALKTWPQRVVTLWVLIVTPVLVVQLAFLVFQLPQFIAIGWERLNKIGLSAADPGGNVLGLIGDVGVTLLALLPVAGLLVFMMQVARGVLGIVRNLKKDVADSGASGEPGFLQSGPDGSHAGLVLRVTGQVVEIPTGGRRPRPRVVRTLTLVIAGVLTINGAYIVSDSGSGSAGRSGRSSAENATAEIPQLMTFSDLSSTHVTSPVSYDQAPPVGGDHSPAAKSCRAYDQPVEDMMAVHSMEHGAVWLTYRPGLSPAEVDRLRRETRRSHVLVSPYPGLPAPVVATAWGHQLRLDSASDERLTQFISRYRRGPQTPEPGVNC